MWVQARPSKSLYKGTLSTFAPIQILFEAVTECLVTADMVQWIGFRPARRFRGDSVVQGAPGLSAQERARVSRYPLVKVKRRLRGCRLSHSFQALNTGTTVKFALKGALLSTLNPCLKAFFSVLAPQTWCNRSGSECCVALGRVVAAGDSGLRPGLVRQTRRKRRADR